MTALKQIVETRSHPIPWSGCWIWQGSTHQAGYGDFRFQGKHYSSHRASYLAFKGDIPNGQQVCHKCDVPSCVNPDHLFLGTNVENIQDSMKKGRRKGITRKRPSGLQYKNKPEHGIWNLKLNVKTRERIRDEYSLGNISMGSLADRYQVSVGTIYRIVKNGGKW